MLFAPKIRRFWDKVILRIYLAFFGTKYIWEWLFPMKNFQMVIHENFPKYLENFPVVCKFGLRFMFHCLVISGGKLKLAFQISHLRSGPSWFSPHYESRMLKVSRIKKSRNNSDTDTWNLLLTGAPPVRSRTRASSLCMQRSGTQSQTRIPCRRRRQRGTQPKK